MTFVDASAIVAILTREAEADDLADALERARSAIAAPVAVFAATPGLGRKRHAGVVEAAEDVAGFPAAAADIRTVSITAEDAAVALDAFSRRGKGRGHPAQLNLGDGFADAITRTHRTTLLFKGDDFDKTDIQPAMATGGA